MTTRVITLWGIQVTSLKTSVSTMHFLAEKMFILKSQFKWSYDKQNLTLVVLSYEITTNVTVSISASMLFIVVSLGQSSAPLQAAYVDHSRNSPLLYGSPWS